MGIYRLTTTHTTTLDATLAEVWRVLKDREAQVEHDARIARIDMVSGAWGEAGSRYVVSARMPDGSVATAEQQLVAVDEPSSYTTRMAFPDGETTSTHAFREVTGGVEWTVTQEVCTRPLRWLEHAALLMTQRRRHREATADHARDVDAMRAVLAAMPHL